MVPKSRKIRDTWPKSLLGAGWIIQLRIVQKAILDYGLFSLHTGFGNHFSRSFISGGEMIATQSPSRGSKHSWRFRSFHVYTGAATARYYAFQTKTMLRTRKSVPRSSKQSGHTRPPDHRKETQSAVVWSCLPVTR